MKYSYFAGMVLLCLVAVSPTPCSGQANGVAGRNNPYSPSPSATMAVKQDAKVLAPVQQGKVAFTTMSSDRGPALTSDRTAPKDVGPVQATLDPTAVYRVAADDVLLITVKNYGSGSYFTVAADGAIDFPMAGGRVVVAGSTVEQISNSVAGAMRSFPNAQLDVRVREFNSHKVMVTGLVQRPGELRLQRDAMPLFAIKAQVGVGKGVKKIAITRAGSKRPEIYDAERAETDSILVYPGDVVEFGFTGPNN